MRGVILKMVRFLTLLIAGAGALLTSIPGQASELHKAEILALQCGALLDVEREIVRQNVTIIVEGERIKSVTDGRVAPKGATVIDLDGKTCLPGLMDMHAHMMIAPMPVPLGEGNSAMFALQAAANIKEMLHSGFTTLRPARGLGQ